MARSRYQFLRLQGSPFVVPRIGLAVSRLGAFFICLLSGVALYSSSGSADTHGFSVGFAHSACIVCDFRNGYMLRLANKQTMDIDAQFVGSSNFFVALSIYGKNRTCADAFDAYGPLGFIHSNLLEK